MPNDKLKHYLHLHFLVFIAGFTAILGELITIGSIPLVWFRMLIAVILMLMFAWLTKTSIQLSKATILKFAVAGIIIALHWITFFEAINQSNVSLTLATFSTGAFFASFIEPIFFKRKIRFYEILFGLLVVVGLILITRSEMRYINGIILGIISAFLSSLFAVINGRFIEKYNATTISIYEFLSGIIFISLFLLIFKGGFSVEYFKLSTSDWIFLFILGSICTAYAFIGSVHIMRFISPYTVVLSYNLEPVYGIILAVILFPEKEIMSPLFYVGVALILFIVLADAILKNSKLKSKRTGYSKVNA
ncbi:DMT family transporter [Paucihalobacter sp.]|uniref:DMT family transporter n=1 Tax=Paucihalobacter sp. TaxID=2850405 RepID=UPI002FE37599